MTNGCSGYVRCMAHPVYVLLPDGVEWTDVEGVRAQKPSPIRWYLRTAMPEATTQVGMLVNGDDDAVARRIREAAEMAEALGGVAVDAKTQERIAPSEGAPLTT